MVQYMSVDARTAVSLIQPKYSSKGIKLDVRPKIDDYWSYG